MQLNLQAYLKVFIILKYIIITNQANQALIFYSSNICALYYISWVFFTDCHLIGNTQYYQFKLLIAPSFRSGQTNEAIKRLKEQGLVIKTSFIAITSPNDLVREIVSIEGDIPRSNMSIINC